VKVRVLYFASIRETLGRGAEDLELPAGVATIAALRTHLRTRGGAWADALAEGRLLRAAVNQDMAQPAASIKAGDEVAFFPPVTGG
jgi:molybdopterin synthase sulfur carrier subunit